MVRKKHVKGTNSYRMAAIILLVLGLWFAWDGWFPREKWREKYPDPSDNFYVFNKSVAVLLLSGAVVCGYIHFVVK